MQNPKVYAARLSGAKYKVVIIGISDCMPGARLLVAKGQPRLGMGRQHALEWARVHAPRTEDDLTAAIAGRLGSHVPRARLEQLALDWIELPVDHRIATPVPSALPTPPRPLPPAQPPTETDRVADLIRRRRSALRMLAEVDRQLADVLGMDLAMALDAGMHGPAPLEVH